MRWIPGSLAVFEGIDRAGKSTQIKKILELPWDQAPSNAHMPSGVANATDDIYQVTESRKLDEPLAVQLLHLAAHVINMPRLLELRARRGLLLDRNDWSTLAYGNFGEGMEPAGISPSTFTDLVKGVWAQLRPDVVFLFDHAYGSDDANTSMIRGSYQKLADQAGELCVRVRTGSRDEVHQQILTELYSRHIVEL